MANSSKLLTRTRNVALALAVTAVLAACGGGGGGGRNNNPGNNVMGDTFAVTTTGRLVVFNRSTGGMQSAIQITGLGNDVPIGFDIRPIDNTLFVVGANAGTGRIYRVDATSGAATVMGTINVGGTAVPLTGTTFGADFNPVPDRIRLVSNTGQNLRINPMNGATTVDGALTVGGVAANGVTEVGYTNNFGNACRTQLFYLDTTMNRLLTTSAPNDGILTVVGAFGAAGASSAPRSSFEVFTNGAGMSTATVVLTVGGMPTVFSLDLTTGAVSAGAQIMGLNAAENFVGIAAMATPVAVTQAAGELTGLTSANQLFTFNSAAPNKLCTGPTAITGLNMGENVVGIDTRASDTNLYGVGVVPGAMGAPGTGRVFQINRMTGAISAAQTIVPAGSTTATPIMGTNFGVDFNPVPDLLRVVSDAGQNLRINATNGQVQPLGANPTDMAINPAGVVPTAAGYTNSFGPARPATTNLYVIDSAAGVLNVQNPPNNGTQVPVGSLGLTGTINAVSGFDINGANNTALAAFSLGTSTSSGLYSINLMTGAATLLAGGNIGAGVGVGAAPVAAGSIRGITFNAVPQATLVGLTADNQLVTFTEAATGTLATSAPVTGLAMGESIVGMDVRPANGLLYAVTNQGATYIINPMTGVAGTRVPFIAAQPPVVMAPDPFTAISGMNFGVDFNPVPDRLRLVSDGMMGNNLRINVANGATITDGNLNAGVTATAAAYTNSVGPSPAPAGSLTTLYTIDTASDRLAIQNPPNNGVQMDVNVLQLGAVGGPRVDATDVGGFDIAGTNNFAAAVLSTNASPGIAARGPTVFTVDLMTGVVSPLGALNVTGAVNGFALPITNAVVDATTPATVLINGNTLGTFTLNNPGTVATASITGLAANETLIGIDFRTMDGMLYGVGTTNQIYRISAAGAATAVGATITTPLDPMAANFGFDFNPVPDRLRIVSNTRQNLRLNPDTGVGVGINPDGTDARLVRADPQPALSFAAAYTNNFGLPDPMRVTQLFVLDAITNSLELQNPPNNGVLVFRGKLTADMGQAFTGVGEFDIAGGDNGLALAALQPMGAMQSNLYRVNLATGLVTQVGMSPIGPAGTQPLVGLAIILR